MKRFLVLFVVLSYAITVNAAGNCGQQLDQVRARYETLQRRCAPNSTNYDYVKYSSENSWEPSQETRSMYRPEDSSSNSNPKATQYQNISPCRADAAECNTACAAAKTAIANCKNGLQLTVPPNITRSLVATLHTHIARLRVAVTCVETSAARCIELGAKVTNECMVAEEGVVRSNSQCEGMAGDIEMQLNRLTCQTTDPAEGNAFEQAKSEMITQVRQFRSAAVTNGRSRTTDITGPAQSCRDASSEVSRTKTEAVRTINESISQMERAASQFSN